MMKAGKISTFMIMIMLTGVGSAVSGNEGFIRSIPFDSPKKGIWRVSNVSFYSKIRPNDVLTQKYAVTKSNILTSITDVELGITDYLTVTGTLPYYADLFSQSGKKGEKTGGGDVAAGIRFSVVPETGFLRGASLGSRFLIPERMVYGREPLGFRIFSSGEFGISVEASAGARLKFVDSFFSASIQTFPGAAQPDSALQTDVFYETGFGYRGISSAEDIAYPSSLFHNQVNLSYGALVPIKTWLAGFVELSHTMFISGPARDTVFRLSPGFRFGSSDRINASIGLDFGINGAIPDKTYQFRITIPSLSRPRLKKKAVEKIMARRVPGQGEKARAQNTFVAVKEFSKSDFTYLYERELRDSFQKQLHSLGDLNVVSGKHVDNIMEQRLLVPLAEKPNNLGVRLGASYIIKTDIFEYDITRGSRFTIPMIIGFPQTNFSIKARTSVTDLISGQTHDLGVVSATVVQPRGVQFFPYGKSSDIIYLSEPERRILEKRLVDRFVNNFNKNILDRIYLFDWDPKRIIVRGDEAVSG